MFLITKDHIADPTAIPGTNANAVGVVGPRTCTLTFDEIVTHPNARSFRMTDDDGELCYEGVYVSGDDSDEFEPLDCFGTPNAGCTKIEFLVEGGGWKRL